MDLIKVAEVIIDYYWWLLLDVDRKNFPISLFVLNSWKLFLSITNNMFFVTTLTIYFTC